MTLICYKILPEIHPKKGWRIRIRRIAGKDRVFSLNNKTSEEFLREKYGEVVGPNMNILKGWKTSWRHHRC